MGLVVGVLGPLEVACNGRPAPVPDSGQKAVLAMLALHAGRPISSERLVEDVWAPTTSESATALLQELPGLIVRLQESLAEAGGVIVTAPSGYRLATDVEVDKLRFEHLAATGRTALAEGQFERAAVLLRQALALFRGPALDDVPGEAARTYAAGLEEARQSALVGRIEADLARGHHAELVEELRDLTREFPDQMGLWAARIRALYRSGRRADALQAFEELRRAGSFGTGVEPPTDIRRLYELVVAQEPTLDWVSSDEPTIRAHEATTPRSGVATFLFTDMVESTASWSRDATRMSRVLLRHNALLFEGVESHNGRIAQHTGDGVIAMFASPVDAIRAAVSVQLAIAREDWGAEEIGVRMGIHTGDAEFLGGDVFGLAISTAARLESAAHGGQILASAVTEQLVRGRLPSNLWLVSHGDRLFRGLPIPMKVFQVCHDGLQQEFPEIRSPRPRTAMPRPSTPFFDPRHDVERVQSLLQNHRLVTLTGPGGVGKSRLAVEVSLSAARGTQGGARWVNLARVDQADLVAHAVASDLQIAPGAGDVVEMIVDHLENQSVLMVLDNCEHHVSRVRSLVAEILHECPDVKILTTSREPLRLADELVMDVEPLLAAANPTLLDVAAELLLTSARAGGASLPDDSATSQQLRDICEELDGLPLAIELAAAQLSTMHPAELQRHLEGRIRVLTVPGDRRVGEPHHHTAIAATVEWSYDRLSPAQQLLFEGLAVFRGGFTPEAVASVCYPEPAGVVDTWQELSELARKSLVRTDPSRPVTRFSLLATIRGYAYERLDGRGDRASTERRHASFYADLAETADRRRAGPDEALWVATEEEELANFRAAVACALRTGEVEAALRIYVALYELAALQGRVEIFDWIEPADFATEPYDLAAAALAMSSIRHGPGTPASVERAEQASVLQRKLGLREHRLLPWARGFAAASGGRTNEAVAAYQESASLIRELEGENGRWITALSLDPRLSRQGAEDLLVRARRIGQPTGLASALVVLARITAIDDPDAALRLVGRASDLAGSVGNVRQLTQNDLAAAAIVGRADPPAAIGYLTSALRYAVDLRQNESVWRCIASIVTTLLRAGYDGAAAEVATMWAGAFPEAASRYPVLTTVLLEQARSPGAASFYSEAEVFEKTFELLDNVERATL